MSHLEQATPFEQQDSAPTTLTFSEVRDRILAQATPELQLQLERALVIHETEQQLHRLRAYHEGVFASEAGTEQAITGLLSTLSTSTDVEGTLETFLKKHRVVAESSVPTSSVAPTVAPHHPPNIWQQMWYDIRTGKRSLPKTLLSLPGFLFGAAKASKDYVQAREFITEEQRQQVFEEMQFQILKWLGEQGVDTKGVHFQEQDVAALDTHGLTKLQPLFDDIMKGGTPTAVVKKHLAHRLSSGGDMLQQRLFGTDANNKELLSKELSMLMFFTTR